MRSWGQKGQSSCRFETSLNIESFLQKSIKIKSVLKRMGKVLKGLGIYYFMQDSTLLMDAKISIKLSLFGAAYAAPNKDIPILY